MAHAKIPVVVTVWPVESVRPPHFFAFWQGQRLWGRVMASFTGARARKGELGACLCVTLVSAVALPKKGKLCLETYHLSNGGLLGRQSMSKFVMVYCLLSRGPTSLRDMFMVPFILLFFVLLNRKIVSLCLLHRVVRGTTTPVQPSLFASFCNHRRQVPTSRLWLALAKPRFHNLNYYHIRSQTFSHTGCYSLKAGSRRSSLLVSLCLG